MYLEKYKNCKKIPVILCGTTDWEIVICYLSAS